jgi:hypothetical protein
VPDRRDVDDARRRSVDQPIDQQLGQEEVADVVHAERHLEPVLCALALREQPTRVVHQHVDVRILVQQPSREGADRCEAREIER